MANKLKVACVQLTSTTRIEENVEISSDLIREAHAKGAQLITMPEVVNLCQRRSELALATVRFENEEPALAAYRALAGELKVWLLVGSLAIKLPGESRLANRSYLIDSTGAVVATYDKIHMFDVNLANGETFRESHTYRPGDRAVVAATPWGTLGMTVCYDVRFPYLYRSVAHAGARLIAVPSAFTRRTGEAHWHILLRARAIETGCFVVAPAQCGDHEDGRKSYGHSLIVGPWGEVIADGGEEPGVVMAEIDFAEVDKARSMIPSLTHDRSYPAPELAGGRAASSDAA
jgi:predicted amidohydrolase